MIQKDFLCVEPYVLIQTEMSPQNLTWLVMMFYADVSGSEKMNPDLIGDPMTFSPENTSRPTFPCIH